MNFLPSVSSLLCTTFLMVLESNLKCGGLSSRESGLFHGRAMAVASCDLKPSCLEVSALGILIQDLEMVTVGFVGKGRLWST